MGSKKHKKHHKSDKKELSFDDRPEKPLKLVLKVGGVQSPVHASNSSSSSQAQRIPPEPKPVFEEPKVMEKGTSHSHEKHKKSKKKKKKKSTEKDKERHDRKRKHQHHHHHHHHREHSHERKEKRRKEQDTSRLLSESHDSRDSVSMRSVSEPHSVPVEKPIRDARTCTLKRKAQKTPLQILLYLLLKKLQMKDPQDFFAWPVTDVIAPGYSSIITNPIDFSTINKKIDDREYKSVAEFKADIKLMCDNAMTYNRSDTVYYKSAKKMWHGAQKIMNRDQLMCLKRNYPYMLDLSIEELGFDIKVESEESLPGTEIAAEQGVTAQPEAKKSKVAPCWNPTEPDDDDDEMSPEEILQQAQKAARDAANRLTLKRPNSKFGFLRQGANGTTTLAIVHPRSGESEMKVNLEMLTGKVSQGSGTIVGYKEDSKNIIKPVHSTSYGAYSSYAPHFDSTFSNLSKEDTELVLSTYGDDIGLQYADSITSYARDNDYLMNMVNNILDNLTGGEHSRTMKILEEKAAKEEETQARKALKPLSENELNKSSPPIVAQNTDIESLQTLEDIDLAISRLEHADTENKKLENGDKNQDESKNQKHKLLNQRRVIQQKLDNATQLLQDLRKVQYDRLGSNPPPHLALIRPPSAIEHELADKVTKKLIDVASQLPPENVVNVEGLRKAMGITYHPTTINKTPKKLNEFERTGSETNVLHDETVLDHSSPPDVSSDDRLRHQDLESDLREFLETGPILRVCDSPTG